MDPKQPNPPATPTDVVSEPQMSSRPPPAPTVTNAPPDLIRGAGAILNDDQRLGLFARARLKALIGREREDALRIVCAHLKEEIRVALDARLKARTTEIQTALEQQLSEIHARHIEYLTDLGLRNVESVVNAVDELQTLVCRLMANPPALSSGVPEQRREDMRKRRMNIIDGKYEQVLRQIIGDLAREGLAPPRSAD